MFEQLKKLGGETLIYGLSSIITSLLSIILIPVYTRIFLPADYGIINLINVTFIVLYIIVVFGLDNSVALWYWKKDDELERKKTFTAWVVFQLLFALLISSVFILFSSFFSARITGSGSNYFLIILAAANFPFWSFQKIVNMWFRVRRRPWHAVFYALFITVSTLVFSILYVVVFKWGLAGVFYAQVTTSGLSFILGLFFIRSVFKPGLFVLSRLREMLHFSYPLVPAAICTWILTSASSYFIKSLKGNTHEVGLYQIGVNIASLTSIVIAAFLQAWSPFALSIHKEKNHKMVYSYVFSLYTMLGSIIVCGIFIFSSEVLQIFTSPEYYDSYWVAGILSVNLLIAGVYQVTSIGCNLAGTNKPYGIAVLTGSVISVILFFLLIPPLGKEGAAIATAFSNAFIAWFLSWKAQKLYYIPYDFVSFFLLVVLLIGISVLSNLITANLTGWTIYITKAIFFASYLLLTGLYYVKVKGLSLRSIQNIFKERLADGKTYARE